MNILISIDFITQPREFFIAPGGISDRLTEVVAGQGYYKAVRTNEARKGKKALREQGLLDERSNRSITVVLAMMPVPRTSAFDDHSGWLRLVINRRWLVVRLRLRRRLVVLGRRFVIGGRRRRVIGWRSRVDRRGVGIGDDGADGQRAEDPGSDGHAVAAVTAVPAMTTMTAMTPMPAAVSVRRCRQGSGEHACQGYR